MPKFIVKLSRTATEIATIEVEAQDSVHAANVAFKEIDRIKDVPQDVRIGLVSIVLKPDQDAVWEEESSEKL